LARPSDTLALSELLGALSCALDMTEGQPAGHSMRCCWIGMAVGREIGLPEPALYELYYALLLKDLGCSSNAAKVADFYRTDDRAFKQRFKTIGPKLTDAVGFLMGNAAADLDPIRRAQALAHVFRHAGPTSRELIATRCHRGAEIALKLGFSEGVAAGVRDLDEHWDGGGAPEGRSGEAISLYARIALLAQAVDVFHAEAGPDAALAEARRRRGSWFDPALVDALLRAAKRPEFWAGLLAPDLADRLLALEPATETVPLDDARLDAIAEGFGLVVDAKSPFTAGHSGRVADFAARLGDALGVSEDRRPWLRRAALLHDIGKLGVSNRLLDKPGRLSDDEWVAMRAHADRTREILGRIAAFDEWAAIAAAHHEKLDGTGYPLRLVGSEIGVETRIITACDVFDALTADRPYRGAMPLDRAFEIMREEVGRGIDPEVLAALERLADADAARAAA
jgi:putative nucleotidyltransferase with HDIG domain